MTTPASSLSHLNDDLYDAVYCGDFGRVASLLAAGASPNARDEDNNSTALNQAAADGFLDCVKLLVEAGANINRRDMPDQSDIRVPILMAIRNFHLDVAEYLLSAGADLRVTDHENRTAAYALVESGLLDVSVDDKVFASALALLQAVLKTPGIANKADTENHTPLLIAMDRDIDPRALEALLANGSDPEHIADSGRRAMHYDWTEDNVWKVRKLLEHGASINSRAWNGTSILYFARDAATVTELISLGADLEHVDDLGRNTLAALLDGSIGNTLRMDEIKQLIVEGIDTCKLDYTGESVESRLIELKTPQAAELMTLIKARQARDALHSASKQAASRSRAP